MTEKHTEHTIETVPSGRKIDPFDLRPEDVDVTDIAFSLSNICRWHGHVDRSVLEHSLDVMELVDKWYALPALSFAALVHDAQEYVLNDLARGVKRQPSMGAYRMAEANAVDTLRKLWGIKLTKDQEKVIKDVDDLLMYLEADRWVPSRGRTFRGWTEEMAKDVERHKDSLKERLVTKPDLRRMFLAAFANLRRGREGGGALVGLTGYKRSGKGTFAGVLSREGGFTQAAFADPIKQQCADFIGISVEELEADKAARRPLLQDRGEAMRRERPDYWINKMRARLVRRIESGQEDAVYAPSFVLTDVRHPNEAKFVRELAETHGMEPLIVRLRRADQPAVTEDRHASETSVDDVPADREVTCASPEDVERAARELLGGKWDAREK